MTYSERCSRINDALLYRKRLTLYVSLLANSSTVLRVAEEELGLCNYMELHF